ncbi:MAG: hypothetical protein C4K58_07930 [Flavobacteriaceae bacterium]|nr:MAG: hypothetical protein C4K58_07930 [Flavobacteriaceae bacterium]
MSPTSYQLLHPAIYGKDTTKFVIPQKATIFFAFFSLKAFLENFTRDLFLILKASIFTAESLDLDLDEK